MNTESRPERLVYFDILRIIAAAFVVMIHSMGFYIENTALYGTKSWYLCIFITPIVRTGVPLFFMISGYLLLNDPRTANIAGFFKRRMSRILLPFLIWDVVYFLYARLSVEGSGVNILDFFKELLTNGSMYHLWYVYTLLGMYLLAPFLRMLVERCTAKQLVWLFFIIIFAGTIRPFINAVLPVYIYLFEPLVEGYFGYFLLGYLLGKYSLPLKARLAIYAGGVAGIAYSVYLNLSGSSAEAIVLKANGGYGINQFLCAAALFTLFKYLPQIKNATLIKVITAVSGTTYGIYLAHALILEIMRRNPTPFTPTQDIIICFAAAFFIPMLVLLPLSRVKFIRRLLM